MHNVPASVSIFVSPSTHDRRPVVAPVWLNDPCTRPSTGAVSMNDTYVESSFWYLRYSRSTSTEPDLSFGASRCIVRSSVEGRPVFVLSWTGSLSVVKKKVRNWGPEFGLTPFVSSFQRASSLSASPCHSFFSSATATWSMNIPFSSISVRASANGISISQKCFSIPSERRSKANFCHSSRVSAASRAA